MNNNVKAEALHQQADDLEEASAKEFAEKSAHFIMCQRSDMLDSSRDDMAIVTISQSMSTLGLIEDANSVALTMFGYAKRDLLRKSVSVIVPYPMSTMHDKYVQSYIETGRTVSEKGVQTTLVSQELSTVAWSTTTGENVENNIIRSQLGQAVMNVTRTVFGRHKNGYLFPMLLCVKPMVASFTGEFTGGQKWPAAPGVRVAFLGGQWRSGHTINDCPRRDSSGTAV